MRPRWPVPAGARWSFRSWTLTATRLRWKALAAAGVTAFAMELMPRITRAQSMDVLSSQANLAGYRAVIDASAEYGRAFPMMMTAAGTVPAVGAGLRNGRRSGWLVVIATGAPASGGVVDGNRRSSGDQRAGRELSALVLRVVEDAGVQERPDRRRLCPKEIVEGVPPSRSRPRCVAEHIKKQDVVGITHTALIPGGLRLKLVSQGYGRLG